MDNFFSLNTLFLFPGIKNPGRDPGHLFHTNRNLLPSRLSLSAPESRRDPWPRRSRDQPLRARGLYRRWGITPRPEDPAPIIPLQVMRSIEFYTVHYSVLTPILRACYLSWKAHYQSNKMIRFLTFARLSGFIAGKTRNLFLTIKRQPCHQRAAMYCSLSVNFTSRLL